MKNWGLLGGGVLVVLYVELKAMLYAICNSDRISHTCNSDSKVSLRLPARIFKMPSFGSSSLTFQAGESIRKHLRMAKDVPRCWVSKWSFGSTGRTAACRLGGKLSGVLSHGTWDWWGTPRSYGEARVLSVALPVTRKKKKLCHGNYATHFSSLLCLVQLILATSFGCLH